MSKNPEVSIVVATTRFNQLRDMISSIQTDVSYQVVAVSFMDIPEDIPCIRIKEESARGCTYAFNQGLIFAQSPDLIHVNDDCRFMPNAIDIMLQAIGDRDVLGAFAVNAGDTVGFVLRQLWKE